MFDQYQVEDIIILTKRKIFAVIMLIVLVAMMAVVPFILKGHPVILAGSEVFLGLSLAFIGRSYGESIEDLHQLQNK